MGLSSSQGRLLMLTSRLSDIELEEIMISQRQNRLAWESEKAASEYNKALNNFKLTIKIPDSSQRTGYKLQNLNYDNMTGMGYLVTNAKNQIYLKRDENDENGDWIIPKDFDGEDLLSIVDGKAVIGDKTYEIADGTEYLKDSKVLQNAIMNGTMYIFKTANSTSGITLENLESDTEMLYELDTSDDAEAESKYNYETARISRQDNSLDIELKQLETQHEAIIKEIDSVKEVIKSNVDRTFDLFSNG